MSKELTENTWVYTDKGIENVHWCNVDSVEELVTPNGKVLSPVPTYYEWKQAKENLDKNGTWYTERAYKELVSKNEQLEKQLAIATKALEDVSLSLWDEMECRSCAKEALKEMEGVK